jgi:hypothetical protein
MLTKRSDAWRVLAHRIAEGNWEKNGLCIEVDNLRKREEVSDSLYESLEEQITDNYYAYRDSYVGLGSSGWYLNFDDSVTLGCDGDPQHRVTAALFLALEAEEEGD